MGRSLRLPERRESKRERERERVWRDHDAVRGRGWRRSGAASAEHVGTERDGPREGAGGECNGEGYGGRARSFHSPLAPRGFPWLGLPLQFSGVDHHRELREHRHGPRELSAGRRPVHVVLLIVLALGRGLPGSGQALVLPSRIQDRPELRDLLGRRDGLPVLWGGVLRRWAHQHHLHELHLGKPCQRVSAQVKHTRTHTEREKERASVLTRSPTSTHSSSPPFCLTQKKSECN